MESKRQRKGLWTLAAATLSANHFNVCGPTVSSRPGRCDTPDRCRLKDRQARPILPRHRATEIQRNLCPETRKGSYKYVASLKDGVNPDRSR